MYAGAAADHPDLPIPVDLICADPQAGLASSYAHVVRRSASGRMPWCCLIKLTSPCLNCIEV